MSANVAPVADIGSLSLTGLSSFRTLLETLSADDVAPLALLQLENLGALFHINGQQAARLPELLQRCSSKRLSDLSVLVGWRKGDSASVMAQTAGGQAIALLCMCLENLLGNDKVGDVLYHLSKKVIPRSAAVCSSTQLARASKILSAKVFPIGFGNILAQQASRLLTIYEMLKKPAPEGLFEPITMENMAGFLRLITQVYQTESRILRIKGSHSMLHFVTVVLIMFPDDATLVVEDTIVQEGSNELIMLHVDSSQVIALTLLEMKIEEENLIENLIAPAPKDPQIKSSSFLYGWHHHVAHALQTDFAAFGVSCTHELLIACSDLFLLCIPLLKSTEKSCIAGLPPEGIQALLGSESIRRIHDFCASVFGATPSGNYHDPADAFRHLESVFQGLVRGHVICTCVLRKCNVMRVWDSQLALVYFGTGQNCRMLTLWNAIGHAIIHSLSAVLIVPSENAVVAYRRMIELGFGTIALDELSKRLCVDLYGHSSWMGSVHFTSLTIVGSPSGPRNQYKNQLAWSNGFSTIIPSPLSQLRYDPQQGYAYYLFDGQLVFDGRYYMNLVSDVRSGRGKTTKSPHHNSEGRIFPCSNGTHSKMSLTVLETNNRLILRSSIVVQGHLIDLDLVSVLEGAMGLTYANPCEHPASSDLSSIWHDKVLITDIESPRTEEPKISIVQTAGDPTAQLLACERGYPNSLALLQRGCCLNCAVAQAFSEEIFQVIVA